MVGCTSDAGDLFPTCETRTGLQDMGGAIQDVSTKVGLVLLVLGVAHFLNLIMFSKLRWRVRLVPPTDPDQHRQVWEHEQYQAGSFC